MSDKIIKQYNGVQKDSVLGSLLSKRHTATLILERYENEYMMDWYASTQPKGTNQYTLEIGDLVVSTGKGQFKKGIQTTITNRQIQPTGHPSYFAGGAWHLEGDLERVEG